MNNKHYLKHAILVLLTVFFSKLQATDYYWVGGTNDYAVDGRCWNTSSTATPSTSTGRLATGSTINSTMIKDVNTAFSALTTSGTPANTFNFNNKLNINLAGAILTSNTVFLNTSSGSNNINLNLNPGGTTIGSTLTFSGEPTFTSTRHIFNFKSSTSTTKVVFSQIGGAQVIYPGKYHNVEFGSAGATSSKIINSGDNVEIQNNLNLYKNLAINGTLTLGSNMTFTYNGGALTLQSTGSISDSRSSKTFNCIFECLNSSLPTGVFRNLFLFCNTSAAGDVTIAGDGSSTLGSLTIGDGTTDFVFDMGAYSLTRQDAVFDISAIGSTQSRIDLSTGEYVYNNLFSNDATAITIKHNEYGSGIQTADSGYIYNFFVDCDAANSPYFDENITMNNITLLNGLLNIEDCVVLVTDNLTTKNGVGTIASLTSNTLPTHINLKTSTANLVINNTTSLLSTFDIDPTLFNNNTIAGLYVNFDDGGEAVLTGDLFVNNSLDLTSTTGNYLKINDYTLTTNGTISSSSTGTKLVGSNKSNLVSGATGTVYFDQTSNSNRTLKDLTVNNDKKLTLGNWLYITAGTIDATTGAPNYDYGKVKVENSTSATSELATGDYLILEATAAGFAQVDVTDGDITGNMHVQTYFDGTHGRRYRFLAPQVTNGNVYSLRDSGSVLTPGSSGKKELVSNWGIQITGKLGTDPTLDTSFDVSTTKNPSAFEFIEANAGSTGLGTGNDAGWKPLHSGAQTLANGKGYRILVRGDRTIELTGTSGNASDQIETTTQITGDYVGTSKTITLYNSGNTSAANNGVNFIGNPYPATIDWDLVYSNNSSSGVDPTYVIYDNTSGSYASYNALSSTGNTCGNLISSGQGFLVYTTTNNASLVIDESCKDVSGLGERFFKKIRTNHLAIKMEKDASNFDRTILYFLPGSTTTYDKYDAGHIKNSSVNLASVDAQNNYYSINCLDTLGVTKSVPLTFDGTAIGTYTISFEDCGTFWNHDIYLVDNFNKTTTRMDDVTKYSFSITSDPFSAQNGRLTVMFAPKEASATSKINKGQGIVISPNPINDKINLNIKEGVSYDFEITNIEGKVIKSGKLDRNSKSINANSLTNGIYFITLNSNSETQTIKFIK